MNILLATLNVLPNLVYGQVAVMKEDGNYVFYKPSRYTKIEDGFNPMDYSILVSDKYSPCIINSHSSERMVYLADKQVKELANKPLCNVGDRIHIKSRRGIYQVVCVCNDTITITCDKWIKYEKQPYKAIHKNDFDRLAGGYYNRRFL